MGIRSLGSRVVLGAIASLLVSVSALAADLKIAYVDQRQAIANSTRGQEAQKMLTDLAAKMQGELQPQQEEYQRLGSELEAQRYVLTGDAIEERRIDLEKKRRDLERELQKAQEELQIEERKRDAGPRLSGSIALYRDITINYVGRIEPMLKEEG